MASDSPSKINKQINEQINQFYCKCITQLIKKANWQNLLIPSLVLNGAGNNTSSKVAIMCYLV